MQNNSRKTIAVIFLGRKGGGPIYSYEMTKGLIENGCNIYLFISKYVENLESWLSLKTKKTVLINTYKGKVSFLINTLLFRWIKYRKIKKDNKKIKVDACYIPMGHPWDRYIVNSLGNPQKIVTIHDPINHSSNNSNYNYYQIAIKVLNWGIYNKTADDIIILSKCFFDEIKESKKIADDHIHVIPHCIFSSYEMLSDGSKYNYHKRFNFLFFGRIDKYKGLEILGQSFKEFNSKYPDSSLTIVGSGDFSYYKELYSTLPNTTIINRWIKDSEVKSFFCSEKNVILVLPYIDATQSGVIPIAMTFGVPIIASNAGGLAEQISDGITGFLFETGDVKALENKMETVSLRDNREIKENARSYILNLTGKELSKNIIKIVQ